MRALVADPGAAGGVRLAEVPEPPVRDGQVLVDVACVSLNLGDLNDANSGRVPAGAVLGSDLAGTVVKTGERVVALAAGAFAQRVAAGADALAVVPEGVELADAAALPVAGVAALQALRRAGSVLGRRVLVTGASGGVGRFAVQLAAHAGASVIAAVGTVERGAGLRELGADTVAVGLDAVQEPVHVVLDTVGGPTLGAAWARLAPGGSLQSIGWASGAPAVLAPYATIGPPKTLSAFLITGPVGEDLATLVDLLARGVLRVDIGWRGSWARATDAATALRERRVDGKAVIDIE